MKLDILLVDFVLVAAVALPYLLFILLGQREESRLKNKFLEEALNYGLHFIETNRWNNNIIGLDKEKTKILFLQKRKAGIVTELIDLKQVRNCSIQVEELPVKINKRTENILQKLELQLVLHNGSIQNISFYNCEETYSQDYEFKHAERWNKTINELIVHRTTINSAA